MKTWSSIGQFKDVVASVRRHYTIAGKPFPTLTFTGRPKLHGTSAGIRRNRAGADLRPQSRNGLISVGSDNAGFAQFVHTNADIFNDLFDQTFGPDCNVTVFGEWAGGSIQPTVALVQVPKHLVVFGAYDHSLGEENTNYIPQLDTAKFQANEYGIYHITQVNSETLTINFNEPHLVQDQLSELVEQYEVRCPWAYQIFGKDGLGEGLVWTCDERPFDSDLWFKTKGDKHSKSQSTPYLVGLSVQPSTRDQILAASRTHGTQFFFEFS